MDGTLQTKKKRVSAVMDSVSQKLLPLVPKDGKQQNPSQLHPMSLAGKWRDHFGSE
jgi:hypothetical protein